MLPLQMPDPALGLPVATVLQPTIFVRNATEKPAAASLKLDWRGDSGQGTAKLPDINLAPFETREIQIAPLQKQLGIPMTHTGLWSRSPVPARPTICWP
jgi:hypothetical protein